MSNDGKRCIFCPFVGKLTDEHIWGDWTRNYVERPQKKHNFASIVAKTPTEEVVDPVRIRAGDPLNSQVKVVCGPCNSGWMSQIQERAKPFLIPLFEGKESVLDSAAQTLIASWAAMATMTGEYLSRDPENIAVSQAERTWFKKNRVPPDNWRILIGKYRRDEWKGQWYHVSMPIYSAKDIPRAKASNVRLPNHQTTSFVVGQLYVHVFSGFFAISSWIGIGVLRPKPGDASRKSGLSNIPRFFGPLSRWTTAMRLLSRTPSFAGPTKLPSSTASTHFLGRKRLPFFAPIVQSQRDGSQFPIGD